MLKKKMFAVFASLSLLVPAAGATPYLRPLDLANPKVIAGGYLDPVTIGASEGGTALALARPMRSL